MREATKEENARLAKLKAAITKRKHVITMCLVVTRALPPDETNLTEFHKVLDNTEALKDEVGEMSVAVLKLSKDIVEESVYEAFQKSVNAWMLQVTSSLTALRHENPKV